MRKDDSLPAAQLDLQDYRRYVDADTSLWYIAYLRDQGFSLEGIKSAQGIINEMMARDNAGRFSEKDDLVARLTDALRAERVAPPRT